MPRKEKEELEEEEEGGGGGGGEEEEEEEEAGGGGGGGGKGKGKEKEKEKKKTLLWTRHNAQQVSRLKGSKHFSRVTWVWGPTYWGGQPLRQIYIRCAAQMSLSWFIIG